MKHKRTLTALTITPTSLLDVLLSKRLVGIIVSNFTALVLLTLNQAFGGQPALLVLAREQDHRRGVGILLGTLTRDVTSLFATVKAMGILLYAPDILYLFPDLPQWIAKLFPTYYIVLPVIEITQQGGAWRDVAPETGVLIALIVALVAVVALAARKTELQPA